MVGGVGMSLSKEAQHEFSEELKACGAVEGWWKPRTTGDAIKACAEQEAAKEFPFPKTKEELARLWDEAMAAAKPEIGSSLRAHFMGGVVEKKSLFRILDANGKEHPYYSGSYDFPKPDMTIVEVKNGTGKLIGIFPHFAGVLLPD